MTHLSTFVADELSSRAKLSASIASNHYQVAEDELQYMHVQLHADDELTYVIPDTSTILLPTRCTPMCTDGFWPLAHIYRGVAMNLVIEACVVVFISMFMDVDDVYVIMHAPSDDYENTFRCIGWFLDDDACIAYAIRPLSRACATKAVRAARTPSGVILGQVVHVCGRLVYLGQGKLNPT